MVSCARGMKEAYQVLGFKGCHYTLARPYRVANVRTIDDGKVVRLRADADAVEEDVPLVPGHLISRFNAG